MTSEMATSSGEVIGVYNDRNSALKIKKAIESAGLSAQKSPLTITFRLNLKLAL